MGGSHSKCPIEFYLLELGLFKLRHIIMKRRMVYHHHILTRNENETIRKIYNKQKESVCKGDWYETILKDFEFIGEVKNDEIIMKIDKLEYKKIIKRKVEKAAIASYMRRKEEKLTKLDAITYTSFKNFNKEAFPNKLPPHLKNLLSGSSNTVIDELINLVTNLLVKYALIKQKEVRGNQS